MSSPTKHYSSLIRVLEACEHLDWEKGDREPRGKIIVSTTNQSDICHAMNDSWITDCFVNNKREGADPSIIKKLTGNKIALEFNLPAPKKEIAIVKDLDALLQYPKFSTIIPEKIFFISKKSKNIPEEYSDTVSFLNLLKATSDHNEIINETLTCFFYNGVKITIPIQYNESHVKILPGIEELKKSFDGPRIKEKIKLFKSSVIKSAIASPSEDKTFPYLLESFFQIKNTFDQDWDLYLSEFSLDEILDELEERILKITDKISSALSDLQKTMLTIPLAIIFAAPRIDTTNIQTLKNGIIVASVWIFALFTWTFFSNHKRTLKFITDEINEQKKVVEEKHRGVADKVQIKFQGLKKRCKYQKIYRRIIGSLMWLATISITAIFLYPQQITSFLLKIKETG